MSGGVRWKGGGAAALLAAVAQGISVEKPCAEEG